ncbi:hypothetical protein CTI12_AA015740 [Artemisia annua]|uniref:Uncharacterized protein n=1 Tax=Artemisia annua TaxID=35608 RepID=A0A2U1QL76_ARTAN|nr:hypothetical protein CTI12_AA015740 [Artemisia annua]
MNTDPRPSSSLPPPVRPPSRRPSSTLPPPCPPAHPTSSLPPARPNSSLPPVPRATMML